MQPSSHSVCLNIQPYDAKGPDEPPAPYGYRRTALGYPAEPPKDHVVWSLCNFLFMNVCCLGFAAFVFSIKSRDRKVVGDADGAASYGKTAKCLNIISLTLVLVLVVILIVLAATGVMAGYKQLQATSLNPSGDWNPYGGK